MNFQLTEEQLAVQSAARDFAQTELLPGVIERDTHQKFPAEQIRKMGDERCPGQLVWLTFHVRDRLRIGVSTGGTAIGEH